MDGSRVRRRKLTDEELLAAWRGLHDGQYSLVERCEENGTRSIVVLRVVRDPRALTPRERQVALRAARGEANKTIAAALGLSVSAVGTYLACAMRKLGCADRTQLARWWSP